MTVTSFSKPVAAVAILVSLAFAGCLGENGEIESKSINLAYQGAESGNHQTTGACDSEGTLSGQGTVQDGAVRIQLVDGSGNVAYDRTYTADFNPADVNVAGASGTWKITGERSGDDLVGDQFQGTYSITVRC